MINNIFYVIISVTIIIAYNDISIAHEGEGTNHIIISVNFLAY